MRESGGTDTILPFDDPAVRASWERLRALIAQLPAMPTVAQVAMMRDVNHNMIALQTLLELRDKGIACRAIQRFVITDEAGRALWPFHDVVDAQGEMIQRPRGRARERPSASGPPRSLEE
jgi:hypothetical protein